MLNIVLKINADSKNKNEAVLSHYPKIPGYPHLFVLDMNSNLLAGTSKLESGKSYDLNRFMSFLKKWAPTA